MITKSKILIVEKEVLITDYLRELIVSEGAKFVKVANDAVTANLFLSTFLPEIILIHINFYNSLPGIDFCKIKNENIKVIFITEQTEIENIKLALFCNPITCITKPLRNTDVLSSIYLALFKENRSILRIKNGNNEYLIKQTDILYIKCENIYLDVYTINKTFTVRSSLEKFIEKLDKDIFIKVHRSYVVNKGNVTKISSKKIYLNEIEIPISRFCVLNI